MSIARRTFPSRLELKRCAGSFRDAPLAKVSFTTLLYDSPVQRMPSCDQTGVPIHFHSSTTSGSASLMSLRILLRVFPRQSPSSAILFEMSSDADWPWLAPGFFMFSSQKSSDRSRSSCLRLVESVWAPSFDPSSSPVGLDTAADHQSTPAKYASEVNFDAAAERCGS